MSIHEVFIYLRTHDAARAVAFYELVFGAKEKFRLVEPSGRVGHVGLALGSTTLMLSDEFPEYGIVSPKRLGGTGPAIPLHVDDADALVQRALDAGAEL